jgi:two-component system, LytTR family, sensor kinase
MSPLVHKKLSFLLEATLASLVIGCLIPFIFFLKAVFTHQEVIPNNFLVGFVFSFTVSFCIYFFNYRIVRKMQQLERSFRSQVARILVELLITISISGVVMAAVFLAFAFISDTILACANLALFDNIMIAIVVNVIVVAIVEIDFFIGKWKHSLIESEQLRRKNVEIQYAALTSQINPHFLFNCLNTLSSLIQTNPEKAIVFTKEFAKIYRYVLDSRDRLIVSLKEELNFLNSYLYLQKIRFDSGLIHDIEIDASCLQLFLPPLSLQLLVENAIKHNEISEENPLYLTIRGKNAQLTISNNYNPIKKFIQEEGGLGIKNLVDRYSHYTDIVPEFKVEHAHYIAIIPLLEDE